MSKFSEREDELISFLQRYRPLPPEESWDGETKLMESLPTREGKRHYLFLSLTAIATGLLLTYFGYRQFQPAFQQAAKERQLEAFLIDNWDATLEMNVTTTE